MSPVNRQTDGQTDVTTCTNLFSQCSLPLWPTGQWRPSIYIPSALRGRGTQSTGATQRHSTRGRVLFNDLCKLCCLTLDGSQKRLISKTETKIGPLKELNHSKMKWKYFSTNYWCSVLSRLGPLSVLELVGGFYSAIFVSYAVCPWIARRNVNTSTSTHK